jgi:hypothetical protein
VSSSSTSLSTANASKWNSAAALSGTSTRSRMSNINEVSERFETKTSWLSGTSRKLLPVSSNKKGGGPCIEEVRWDTGFNCAAE